MEQILKVHIFLIMYMFIKDVTYHIMWSLYKNAEYWIIGKVDSKRFINDWTFKKVWLSKGRYWIPENIFKISAFANFRPFRYCKETNLMRLEISTNRNTKSNYEMIVLYN